MKLDQLIDIDRSNIFRKDFANFKKLGLKLRPFFIHQCTKITLKTFMVSLCFFSVLKMYPETIENSKRYLIKNKISYYIAILSK